MSRINSFLELLVNQGGPTSTWCRGIAAHPDHGVLHKVRFRELPKATWSASWEFLDPEVARKLEQHLSVGFAYECRAWALRANICRITADSRRFQSISSASRLDELGSPGEDDVAQRAHLVTGPTGSGNDHPRRVVDYIN
jgi:hypothetical protein